MAESKLNQQGSRVKWAWAQTLVAVGQIVVVGGLGAILAVGVYEADEDVVSRFVLWTLCMLLIVLSSSALGRLASRGTEAYEGKVSVEEENFGLEVQDLVRKFRRPRIELLEGIDEVCERAAGLIHNARKEKNLEKRWIIFLGAASLGVPDMEVEVLGGGSELPRSTPFQNYIGAVESAVSEKVSMLRLVHLPKTKEVSKRSDRVRREFERWVINQYAHLRRNERYELVDMPRAASWGGNGAMIVTARGILEIVGKGEAGLWVEDDFAAEVVSHYAKESIQGNEGGVAAEVYGVGAGRASAGEFGSKWKMQEVGE